MVRLNFLFSLIVQFFLLGNFALALTGPMLPPSPPQILTPYQKALNEAEASGNPMAVAFVLHACFYQMPGMGNEEDAGGPCFCNWENAPQDYYAEVQYECFVSQFQDCMAQTPSPNCYNIACISCLGRRATRTEDKTMIEGEPLLNW